MDGKPILANELVTDEQIRQYLEAIKREQLAVEALDLEIVLSNNLKKTTITKNGDIIALFSKCDHVTNIIIRVISPSFR